MLLISDSKFHEKLVSSIDYFYHLSFDSRFSEFRLLSILFTDLSDPNL